MPSARHSARKLHRTCRNADRPRIGKRDNASKSAVPKIRARRVRSSAEKQRAKQRGSKAQNETSGNILYTLLPLPLRVGSPANPFPRTVPTVQLRRQKRRCAGSRSQMRQSEEACVRVCTPVHAVIQTRTRKESLLQTLYTALATGAGTLRTRHPLPPPRLLYQPLRPSGDPMHRWAVCYERFCTAPGKPLAGPHTSPPITAAPAPTCLWVVCELGGAGPPPCCMELM
jgi:hypothetical protein